MARNKLISHEKIIEAAKQEFLEKGFDKASMRQIGKLAGMTQAALYRHYPSKEAMFCDLVDPAIKFFEECRKIHLNHAYNDIKNNKDIDEIFIVNNISLAKEIYTKYHDEFKMIICCSQGTKYEKFLHDLVTNQQKHLMDALKYLESTGRKVKQINPDELHLLLSAYVTAVFEPIEHDWPLEQALHGLDVISAFFVPGWKKIMGF